MQLWGKVRPEHAGIRFLTPQTSDPDDAIARNLPR